MTPTAMLIVLAAGVGVGLTLVVAWFVPPRPRLADVLERRDLSTTGQSEPAYGGVAGRALRLLERFNIATPQAELELVGRSRESLLLQRLGFALGGAAWIPLLALILSVGGIAPPAFLTAGAALGAAVVGWFLPLQLLRSSARQARTAFKGALACYFELVALGRVGDLGPSAALTYPANLGTGYAFGRIRQALSEAILRGQMPWEGLQRLAAAMGVKELDDLGSIITVAGQDGASIVDTLRAKAKSIRAQQLAEERAASSIRSDRMDAPVGFMGVTFVLFIAFPGLYGLLSA